MIPIVSNYFEYIAVNAKLFASPVTLRGKGDLMFDANLSQSKITMFELLDGRLKVCR
jgi:hypothetical protein